MTRLWYKRTKRCS